MSYQTTILAESGLVSDWEFDETSGTTAADSKGTNVGTYTGGYTLGQAGVSGNAVLLNGTTGYVTVPDAASLHLSGALSLEAWVKTTSTSTSVIIVAKFAPTSFAGWGLRLAAGKASLWVGDGTNGWFTGNTSMADGKWHHVVGTLSGTTVSLYVDGLLDNSGTRTASLTNTTALQIGTDPTGPGGSSFAGTVDAVALYNTVLPAASVLAHYQAVYPAPAADTSSYHSTVAGTTGLVGYWPLNETVGAMAYDSIGGKHLLYQGSYTLGQASGISGMSVLMAGTVDAGAGQAGSPWSPPVTANTNLSWEVWFKLTNTTSPHQRILGQSNFEFGINGYNGGYVSDGSVYLYNSGSWNINISVKILDSTWHHMVVTVDGSGIERMYLDGSLAWTLSGVAYPAPGAGWKWGNGVQGNLDEAAVYNTALSATTIQAHYNASPTVNPLTNLQYTKSMLMHL